VSGAAARRIVLATRVAFAVAAVGACLPVLAQRVVVDCDRRSGTLTIDYAGRGPDRPAHAPAIDFEALVSPHRCPAEGPCMITSLKSVTRSCRLGGATYRMTFRPVPGNANRQGLCGGLVSGSVEIRKDGRPFLGETTFEEVNRCFVPDSDDHDDPVDVIRIVAGRAAAEVVRRNAHPRESTTPTRPSESR